MRRHSNAEQNLLWIREEPLAQLLAELGVSAQVCLLFSPQQSRLISGQRLLPLPLFPFRIGTGPRR